VSITEHDVKTAMLENMGKFFPPAKNTVKRRIAELFSHRYNHEHKASPSAKETPVENESPMCYT